MLNREETSLHFDLQPYQFSVKYKFNASRGIIIQQTADAKFYTMLNFIYIQYC